MSNSALQIFKILRRNYKYLIISVPKENNHRARGQGILVAKEFFESVLNNVGSKDRSASPESTTDAAAVDACLSQGLKRRAVGLFKGNNTTFSLLKQLSKNYPPAQEVLQKVHEIELRLEANKKHSNGDSPSNHTPQQNIRTALQQKHLWIRVALFEKYLAKICENVSQNGSKYFDKDSLMSDPVDGPILASLLVGPCALDYSKMKTADHYWTDPPADELVQRHRIHSAGPGVTSGSNSPRRPGLQVKKTATGTTPEEHCRTPVSARDYVESLHQNSRSTLLYGKNNVLVQPVSQCILCLYASK
nr:small G protein signaling modulator 1-like [Lytechinus pictus]